MGAWAGGSTTEWRKVRARVLARDGYRCQVRLSKCTTTATQVHHTSPRELVGDDPAFLVASCQYCNVRSGSPNDHTPAVPLPAWLQ